MNLIDIESYIKRSIPTEPISNELLVKPKPPTKMKEHKVHSGGNQRPRRPRRGKGPPRSHHQRNKKAV